MIRLNHEELLIGFIYGLISCFAVGFYGVFIAAGCSFLWALGGAGWLGTNMWRRIGCPLLMFGAFKWQNPSSWSWLGLALSIAALCTGYGEPSTQPPDEGSWLGRRFGRWTRPVWFLILALATAPMFIK